MSATKQAEKYSQNILIEMRKTTKLVQFGAIVVMALATSCISNGNDNPNITPNPINPETIETQQGIVKALAGLPNPAIVKTWGADGSGNVKMLSSNDPIVADGKTPTSEPVEIGKPVTNKVVEGEMAGVPGHWVTTAHKYEITHEYDEQILLDSHNDVIYPGSVLLSDQIVDGRYGAVTTVPIGPITFSISAAAGTFKGSEEISHTIPADIRMSDYRKQYSKWCNLDMQATPSIVMHSMDVVNSEFDIMSRMGANISQNDMFKLKLNFGLDFNSKKNHIFGQFLQRSFSVTTDFPKTATIFSKYVPGVFRSRPVYVSNINYGRMAFVSVETDQHLAEVQAALDFVTSKNEKNVEADLSAEAKAKKLFENSKINIVIVGGGASRQRKFLNNVSIEGFREFMSSDIPVNELIPVNFQLRYVHDNSLARIITTRRYQVANQEFIPDFDCLTVDMAATGFITSGPAGLEPDKKNEIFGQAYMIDGTLEKGTRIDGDLLNITEWLRVPGDGKTFYPYMQGSHLLKIKRKAGEKPEDFLKRRITFVTDLQEQQPGYTMPYGQGVYEMSIAQLISIANSMEPGFFVTSQRKEYSAKVRIEVKGIQYLKNNIKILDGKNTQK